MYDYVKAACDYLTHNKLWAHQGGPIILAQIENELGSDMDNDANVKFMGGGDSDNNSKHNRGTSSSSSYSPAQQYADWCGAIAQQITAPQEVVWTMCNGLVAPNVIETHNGDYQFESWLNRHGDSGRIQVDQPALWTENEGGFQLWGEDAAHPTDYFWGHTAREMARTALQWFARGGSHLNYCTYNSHMCKSGEEMPNQQKQ